MLLYQPVAKKGLLVQVRGLTVRAFSSDAAKARTGEANPFGTTPKISFVSKFGISIAPVGQ